jgi:GNAT superfamily N-acetyltransferase
MRIQNSTELNESDYIDSLKHIFFTSSHTKSFDSEEAKEKFFMTWAGNYLKEYPQYFYFAFEDDFLLGYLCGCPNSHDAVKNLKIPGLAVFENEFEKYPAHLHINCHPESRGKGVGRKLIETYVEDLKKNNVPGLHIITGEDADNIKFYEKTNFDYKTLKPFKNVNLCFMGRDLSK